MKLNNILLYLFTFLIGYYLRFLYIKCIQNYELFTLGIQSSTSLFKPIDTNTLKLNLDNAYNSTDNGIIVSTFLDIDLPDDRSPQSSNNPIIYADTSGSILNKNIFNDIFYEVHSPPFGFFWDPSDNQQMSICVYKTWEEGMTDNRYTKDSVPDKCGMWNIVKTTSNLAKTNSLPIMCNQNKNCISYLINKLSSHHESIGNEIVFYNSQQTVIDSHRKPNLLYNTLLEYLRKSNKSPAGIIQITDNTTHIYWNKRWIDIGYSDLNIEKLKNIFGRNTLLLDITLPKSGNIVYELKTVDHLESVNAMIDYTMIVALVVATPCIIGIFIYGYIDIKKQGWNNEGRNGLPDLELGLVADQQIEETEITGSERRLQGVDNYLYTHNDLIFIKSMDTPTINNLLNINKYDIYIQNIINNIERNLHNIVNNDEIYNNNNIVNNNISCMIGSFSTQKSINIAENYTRKILETNNIIPVDEKICITIYKDNSYILTNNELDVIVCFKKNTTDIKVDEFTQINTNNIADILNSLSIKYYIYRNNLSDKSKLNKYN